MTATTTARAAAVGAGPAPGVTSASGGPGERARRWTSTVCRSVRTPQAAQAAFWAYTVIAWCLLLMWWGAGRWFTYGDFATLTSRDAGDWQSLIRADGSEFVAVPALVLRATYNLIGLRFGGFLVLIVSLHVAVSVLVRRVALRSGCTPWVATFVGAALTLFGSGRDAIVASENVDWACALVFGLASLLLIERPGSRARDVGAVICAMAAVASSTIAVVIVVVACAVCALGRTGRVPVFFAAPIAAFYAVWYALAEPRSSFATVPPLRVDFEWARLGVTGPVEALAGTWGVAVLVGAAAVAGWAVVIRRERAATFVRFATPLCLLVGAVAFSVVSARELWWIGSSSAVTSRQVYGLAVFVLPALGVGLGTLASALQTRASGLRRIVVTGALVGSVAFGFVVNVSRMGDSAPLGDAWFDRFRQTVLGAPSSIEFAGAPSNAPFIATGVPTFTVGWLRTAVAEGRVPPLDRLPPDVAAEFPLRLGLVQGATLAPPPAGSCEMGTAPLDLRLVRGERLAIGTDVLVTLMRDGAPASPAIPYLRVDGSGVLYVVTATIDIRVTAVIAGEGLAACRDLESWL